MQQVKITTMLGESWYIWEGCLRKRRQESAPRRTQMSPVRNSDAWSSRCRPWGCWGRWGCCRTWGCRGRWLSARWRGEVERRGEEKWSGEQPAKPTASTALCGCKMQLSDGWWCLNGYVPFCQRATYTQQADSRCRTPTKKEYKGILQNLKFHWNQQHVHWILNIALVWTL